MPVAVPRLPTSVTPAASADVDSSGSSNRRRASATRCSTASCACGPLADTSTSWPHNTASVATLLRLDPGTGPAPVVALRNVTVASRPRSSPTRRAAGRACRPCLFVTVKTAMTSAVAVRATSAVSSTSARCAALPNNAPRASAATSKRSAPPAAATAATTSPSTIGAGDSTTRSRIVGSDKRSRASSVLRTALPRSIRTTTPAAPSTCSMASLMATASVPNVASSRPAATPKRTARPCNISDANATAARASARLWETTTMPTVGRLPAAAEPATVDGVPPGSLLDTAITPRTPRQRWWTARR